MLNRIQNLLTSDRSSALDRGKLTPTVAICTLLLEIAKADGVFSDEERQNVVFILRNWFDLTEQESSELIAEAEQLREQSLDLWSFTHVINQQFTREERVDILIEVWHVILADDVVDAHEDYLVRQLTRLLDLNHSDMIEAKIIARQERDDDEE